MFMKLGIVSDVHSNLFALQKVLEHMESQGVDKKVNLGIVGYGPYPNECVELTVANFNYILMGNHDESVFNLTERYTMNPRAVESAEWTAKQLKKSNRDFLANLEYGYVTEEKLLFVHGAPHAPFAYMDTYASAINGFKNPIEDFQVAFVGHTHVPIIWELENGDEIEYIRPRFGTDHTKIDEWEHYIGNSRAIINVGGVGQPRDGDPRASYVIFDTETNHVKFYRVPYSVDRTIARMQQLGFATEAWARLMYGQ
jgi:diadenosine tetraphosphatase ApaH/serine/threonine PP2A family protein phosphatase